MPFKLTHHDSKYFHAQGTKGPFKIAKRGLGKSQRDKYLAMCDGGVVPKKMAEGGEVDWATGQGPTQEQIAREAAQGVNAAGKVVAGAVSPRPNSLGELAVTGIRSILPGSPGLEEERRRYRQDSPARSVVHPPLNTPAEHMAWLRDPENPETQEAMETAMNFMGAVGPAKKGAKAVAAAVEGAAPKAAPRTRVGLIPWDEMNLPEAVQAARDKAHLLQLDGGHYVGAPPAVTNPAKLGAMRGKIDKAVERGAFGADWYERARKAIAEISHSDPKTADKLSALLANYSPQATPDSNFGWAIQQMNRSALEGPAASALNPPKTKVQARKGAQILAGEPLDLGPKAGVYEQHINPNKADEAMVRGVNDLWQGRVFGYPPGKDASVGTGLAAKAGFSEAQHSFMTGENLLAAERAKAKGLLPQVETPNVGNVQAASWVGQRYNQLLAKEKAAAAKAKAAGKPFKAKSDEEIRRKAAQSYDTVLDKYTAHEPHTTAPEGLSPEDANAWDRQMSWAKPGEADPFYKALDMPARPTEVTSVGMNARPMVSFTKGNPNKGGIGAPEQTMIENVNRLRTVLDGQGAGDFHSVRRAGSGQNAAPVRFPQPLSQEGVLALREQAQAAGLDLHDLGGGAFTLVGDHGSMPAKDFTARIKGAMQEPLTGARVEGGRFLPGHEGGAYTPAWYEGEGSGVVTQDLLSRMDPRVAAKIDASPELRALIGERAGKHTALAAEHGMEPPRADLQRLRGMISDQGIQGLKEYIAKHGAKGLPALLPIMLAEEAARGPEQHAQGGIAGEQVQRFEGGGVAEALATPQIEPPYFPTPQLRAPNPWAASAPGIDPSMVQEAPPAQPAPASPPVEPTIGDYEAGVAVPRSEGKGLGDLVMAIPNAMQGNYEALTQPTPPPDAPAGAPTAAYNGPGSPNWQGNAVYQPPPPGAQPPPIPQMPAIKPWGTGAPQEIAAASKAAGVAMQEKAKLEKNALDEMASLQQRSALDIQSFSAGRAERYRQRQAVSDQMERDLLDAKVNPNQFFEQRDTGQKVLAGIGMLFSGIGAGLTGAPNLAMDVINRAIDRDIDAQKFNIGKQQNYLSYYVKKTGDELIATNYMKADLLDSVAAQIKAMELGMQATTVGPMAQIAYQHLRMQSAELRQRASLQEQQGQINDYNFKMQKMRLDMMQRLLGAQPGAALTEDHTPWLKQATVLGVVPRNETAIETRTVPNIDPRTGAPMVDAYGKPITHQEQQWRWYADPERARKADETFRGTETLMPAVHGAVSILEKYGAGTNLLRHPEANAELKQQLAHILISYERVVNQMQRQPNEETITVLKEALDNPGGVKSSVFNTSVTALRTIEKQVEAALQSQRHGAHY